MAIDQPQQPDAQQPPPPPDGIDSTVTALPPKPPVDDKPTTSDTGEEQQLTLRSHETRKSKSKRVKSYLKRCKGALTKSDEGSCDRKKNSSGEQQQQQQTSSSWYIDGKKATLVKPEEEDDEEELQPRIEEVFELCKPRSQEVHKGSRGSLYEDARDEFGAACSDVVLEGEEEGEVGVKDDGSLNKCDSSDTLIAESQEPKEDSEEDGGPATPTIIPNAVVSLMNIYL